MRDREWLGSDRMASKSEAIAETDWSCNETLIAVDDLKRVRSGMCFRRLCRGERKAHAIICVEKAVTDTQNTQPETEMLYKLFRAHVKVKHSENFSEAAARVA